MRHGRKINHLSRTSEHRKAMLSNMASSLIRHKKINTTLAKARALRKFVEPILTKSKTDSTHSRRMVFSYLKDKEAVIELFRDIAPKIAARPGGYTRILKTGNRLGDNAEMCFIELVDYNENMLGGTAAKKAAKPTRRRGGKAKTTKGEAETAEATETAEGTEAPAKKAPAKKAAAKKEGAPAAKKTAAKKSTKKSDDKE
jgi:large subunit ribosomal protein L17